MNNHETLDTMIRKVVADPSPEMIRFVREIDALVRAMKNHDESCGLKSTQVIALAIVCWQTFSTK